MGFWHTGYIDFHEPTGLGPLAPRQPSLFICDRCDESFSSAAARGDHCFEAHPQHKLVLIAYGATKRPRLVWLLAGRPLVARVASPTRRRCQAASVPTRSRIGR